MLFSKALYVFDNQALIEYFINYRIHFNGEYMLKEEL